MRMHVYVVEGTERKTMVWCGVVRCSLVCGKENAKEVGRSGRREEGSREGGKEKKRGVAWILNEPDHDQVQRGGWVSPGWELVVHTVDCWFWVWLNDLVVVDELPPPPPPGTSSASESSE